MTGRVDKDGRALVTISIRATASSQSVEVEAWIDTGFTGELVLPQTTIDSLGLEQTGTLDAQLGDGSFAVLHRYSCLIRWLGRERTIVVVANSGSTPLLGVALLLASKLSVDYPARVVAIE